MWYFSKNGMQLGPVTQEELSEKAKSGEVSSSDLVWKEGLPDWIPLGQVPEFQSLGIRPAVPPQIPQAGLGTIPIQQPAPVAPSSYVGQTVPNYLWQSIVVTVLCCMPFGVVAIVFAAKVDGLVARGDIAGAMSASASAKTWTTVGAIVGGLFTLGMMILMAIGAANS